MWVVWVIAGALAVYFLMLGKVASTPTPDQSMNQTDKVTAIATGIAIAENGNTLPYTFGRNNPGNIRGADGNIKNYATQEDGWTDLYKQIGYIVNGQSRYYNSAMTWRDFAWMWVAGTQPGGQTVSANDKPDMWASYIAGYLGVDVSSTVGAYLNG